MGLPFNLAVIFALMLILSADVLLVHIAFAASHLRLIASGLLSAIRNDSARLAIVSGEWRFPFRDSLILALISADRCVPVNVAERLARQVADFVPLAIVSPYIIISHVYQPSNTSPSEDPYLGHSP